MGLFETTCLLRKRLNSTCPDGSSSPPPPPPRNNHPQPTQNTHPIKFPHYQCVVSGTDPMNSPHPRIQCTHPEPASDRTSDLKNTHLKPSRHRTGTTTVTHPQQNVTYVIRGSCPHQGPSSTKRAGSTFPHQPQPRHVPHTMGQDYPVTVPSPGANPPIYPSSLPLT
jgi:hypothetical protein